jgi:hypothetical protein
MHLQKPPTDDPVCTTCSIGKQCSNAAEGPQGRQGEPQPPGSCQAERHWQGRSHGVDAPAPLTVPMPGISQACGSLVDWMSAARETKDRERMPRGAACTHNRCTHKYKRGRYMEAQARRLRQILAGDRTLCSTPLSQRDDMRLNMGGPHAVKAVLRVTENI